MEIRQITEQNPWWEDREKIKEDEKIKIALTRKHKIIPFFKEGNFIFIGPRQVGKTTYLKLSIYDLLKKKIAPKNILYFSCETLRDFQEIIEIIRFTDTLGIKTNQKKYFFFDEITFVQGWQKAIKYVLDSPLGKNKNFYITGSSSLALKRETFPGRKIEIKDFLPLSFKGFCQIFGSKNLKKEIQKNSQKEFKIETLFQSSKNLFFSFNEASQLFESYLKTGGFLRAAYEFFEEEGIKEETYEIYWKWLVSDIAKVERSERITQSILIAILKNYSSRFSLNSIAKEMEIGSHVTIREYLEILENLFVLRNIFPIDLKRKTEIFRKMRKVYFTDPFLFEVFKKNLSKESVSPSEIPKIIEGIIGEHLTRVLGRIFYLIQKRGKEIDFVFDNIGIEVKWQNKINFQDFPKIEIKDKILLTRSNFEYLKKEKFLMLPVCIFLLAINTEDFNRLTADH